MCSTVVLYMYMYIYLIIKLQIHATLTIRVGTDSLPFIIPSCLLFIVAMATHAHSEAKEVTVTQQSKWREQWEKLRENNPVSNSECQLKVCSGY